MNVLDTLAGAEASVSWLIWNNTLPCFWSRFLDDAARERIFSDSSQLFAGSTRPTGRAVTTEGGVRLSGRWSLVSGCELADDVHLMSLVHEDGEPRIVAPGQPDLRVLFVPKGSYDILDTWHVGGLRGSGSHDVVVAMHPAAGTPALYIDCPLERSIRDLQTMERHMAAQPLWLEDAGRVLLGHEPTNPLFMI